MINKSFKLEKIKEQYVGEFMKDMQIKYANEEMNSMSKEKSKSVSKWMAAILSLVLLFGVFTGCGSTKLSDKFDKDTVLTGAKTVIEDINAEDYGEATADFDEYMSEKLPAETLESNISETMKAAGEFKEYKSESVIGQQKKEEDGTKSDYAVAIIVAEYENKNLTFTVSYNREMKITGLYLK